jgi:hypothetical protein
MLHKEWTLHRGGPDANHANHCENIPRGERSRCVA